ncbi:MAG: hypothetical protein ACLPN1_11485 [Dissulfurispiraceae bacterium]|jgi:uncharacterized protein YndB with AHSA1/START domain
MGKDFLGKWFIAEMEQWDKEYIDLEEDGYFAIKKKGIGEFKFGAVEGQMDYVIEKIGDEERLEFTWDGSDEMDPVSGRGWITFKDNGLHGKIYFHMGEQSWFKAKKSTMKE